MTQIPLLFHLYLYLNTSYTFRVMQNRTKQNIYLFSLRYNKWYNMRSAYIFFIKYNTTASDNPTNRQTRVNLNASPLSGGYKNSKVPYLAYVLTV